MINNGVYNGGYTSPITQQTLYDQLLNQYGVSQSNLNMGGNIQNKSAQLTDDIIRVSGIEEARKYPMNGRDAIIMLDFEKPIMYFKYISVDGAPPYYTNVVEYSITPIVHDDNSDIIDVNTFTEEADSSNNTDYAKIIEELKEVKNTVDELSNMKSAIGEIKEIKEMLKSIL